MYKFIRSLMFAILMVIAPSLFSDDLVVLPRDAIWRFNDSGVDLGSVWREPGYKDFEWKRGRAPLGFGDDVSETDPNIPLATTVSFGADPQNKHMTTYFRTEIEVPSSYKDSKELEVYIHVDDGAVVYFNGVEVFRRGIKDDSKVAYNTPGKFKPKEETFTLPASLLKVGSNLIAAEVHQDGVDSSDLWFEMGLKARGVSAHTTTSTTTSSGAIVRFIPDSSAPRGSITKVTQMFGSDPATTRAFTWYTTFASGSTDVQVVEVIGASPNFSKAFTFSGRVKPSYNSPDELVHMAEAVGLKSGTSYWYRVGDAKLGLWSDVGTFKTMDNKKGPFTFINLADTQAKTEDEAILSAKTLADAVRTVKNAEFMIINGDIVDTGRNEKQWDWVLGHAAETMRNIAFIPAAGNHDEDPYSFIEHFNLPVPKGADIKTGAYYSFDYKNAHFIILNNNEDSPEWADFSLQQIEWFKSDVLAAKARGTDWIILIVHKGPYTTSNHATDEDITGPNGVRTKFAPLAAQLGVDLVFQGHDHSYSRTKSLNGVVYITPGTAGPKVYYLNKKIDSAYWANFVVAKEHPASKYGSDPADQSRPMRGVIQNFLAVTINGKNVSITAYEVDRIKGGLPYVIDTLELKK
ncbi:purple acid phosphatase family protein [Gracilinema caldarium]|uniref:Metallophosphoesterase n=1 Tax=Gracilinema caldarium (strain ATCC 51460 / DSM 7334 / H1) TaxID=744872 RepID=F8EYE2_GRAC1|nr:metallophosphoesterase family protein [Gracilinema caldarium]AEJ18374.1 metallophosphoesterase [Gracilinema caldarium DSM 7334]